MSLDTKCRRTIFQHLANVEQASAHELHRRKQVQVALRAALHHKTLFRNIDRSLREIYLIDFISVVYHAASRTESGQLNSTRQAQAEQHRKGKAA